MNPYDVIVRNELTGEVVSVSIVSSVAVDAQVEALRQLFRTRGWRKASALPPNIAEVDPDHDAA